MGFPHALFGFDWFHSASFCVDWEAEQNVRYERLHRPAVRRVGHGERTDPGPKPQKSYTCTCSNRGSFIKFWMLLQANSAGQCSTFVFFKVTLRSALKLTPSRYLFGAFPAAARGACGASAARASPRRVWCLRGSARERRRSGDSSALLPSKNSRLHAMKRPLAEELHAFNRGHGISHQLSKDAATGDDSCRRCVSRQSGCNADRDGCHRAVPPLAGGGSSEGQAFDQGSGTACTARRCFLRGLAARRRTSRSHRDAAGGLGSPCPGPRRVRCCLWSIPRQRLPGFPGLRGGRAGSSRQIRRQAAPNSCPRHPERRLPGAG